MEKHGVFFSHLYYNCKRLQLEISSSRSRKTVWRKIERKKIRKKRKMITAERGEPSFPCLTFNFQVAGHYDNLKTCFFRRPASFRRLMEKLNNFSVSRPRSNGSEKRENAPRLKFGLEKITDTTTYIYYIICYKFRTFCNF